MLREKYICMQISRIGMQIYSVVYLNGMQMYGIGMHIYKPISKGERGGISYRFTLLYVILYST